MIHFLNKLWKNSVDDSVHFQFVRFGKGIFEKRFVFKVRKGDPVKLNSTFELATDLILFAASIAKSIHVEGVILSKEKLPFEGKKKGQLTAYNVNKEMTYSELEELSKKAYFMLLDGQGEGVSLKVKKTLPKPKPKGADSKVNDKFCVLEVQGSAFSRIKEEFLFGLPEGKKYEVEHRVAVDSVIIPDDEKDPEQIRLKAQKKGKITRKAIVDGKEIVVEKDFVA